MYGGTKTEMERLLSDAEKISGQKYDISNLSDVYSAIHVIQKEMGITGTSAKEAETTLSGSFNAMKAAAQNFMGNLTLGQNVTASMQGLVTTTSTYLFKNLLPAIGRIFQSLPAAMGTFIQQGVPELMTSVQSMLTSLATSMKGSGGIIKSAFTGLLNLSDYVLDNSGGLISAGMDMLKNLANGIVQALPTIIQTVPKIISNFANVINNNAPTILSTGISIIKTLAVGIIKAIPTLIANLPQIVKAIWDVFTAIQWVNLGSSLINGIKNGVKTGFSGAITNLKSLIGSGIEGIKTAALVRCQSAVNALHKVFLNVVKFISSPFRTALKTVVSIVSSIKSAINFASVAGKVRASFTAVKNAITNPIATAKSLLAKYIKLIKNMFPFNLGKILHLKLPHLSVSGGKSPYGIGGKGKLPSFNVSWYKEGGIVDGATLIGAGEAGAEGIVPLAPFWNRMDSTLAAMQNSKGESGGNVTVVLNLDGKTIAQSTIDYVNNQTITMGTNPLTV
jgi:phage-related protein